MKDDPLDLPKPVLPMNSPEAIAKRSKTRSDNMKIPDEVELPGDDPEVHKEMWPYPLPSRDGKNIGRPRIYDSPEQFDSKVDEYFDLCFTRRVRPIMTGLRIHLGVSHQGLTDYSKRPEFSDSVSRARDFIKAAYEGNLVRHQGSVQGVMFALKNLGRTDDEFVDINKSEITGKNGQPIAVTNADLDKMTDLEKAQRIFLAMQRAVKAKQAEQTKPVIEGEKEKDPLEI